jgi:hypothetical protein
MRQFLQRITTNGAWMICRGSAPHGICSELPTHLVMNIVIVYPNGFTMYADPMPLCAGCVKLWRAPEQEEVAS